MTNPITFHDFNEIELFDIIKPYDTESAKKKKDFFKGKFDKNAYWFAYLKLLDAKYVVVEHNYKNKDYSKDHNIYYNVSFLPHNTYCKRVHFFASSERSCTDFEKMLWQNITNSNSLQNNDIWDKFYLGYIIIKPLPNSFIGYTLLRHYNYNPAHNLYKNTRNYFAARKYKIHLFGCDIDIETLAFQEQDSMVAACATMCVWFVQQKAIQTNLAIRKSPGEITKDVGDLSEKGNRLFPNYGLRVKELCRAIQKNGLEPLVRDEDINFASALKKWVYAYSGVRLPIILCHNELKEDKKNLTNKRHAIAVCGYRAFKNDKINLNTETQSIFYSDYLIEKFFVHDDQIGPFASLDINGNNMYYKHRIKPSNKIGEVEKYKYRYFKPETVIIPMLPRVKVDYEQIEALTGYLHNMIAYVVGTSYKPVWEDNIIWDIRLMYSNDYKREIKDSSLDEATKYKIITKSMPKLIWVSKALLRNEQLNPVLDFIFDVGGLQNTMICLEEVYYLQEFENEIFKHTLKEFKKDIKFMEKFLFLNAYVSFFTNNK